MKGASLTINAVTLVWLPHRVDANGRAVPVY